jgi:hypothetical protein
VASFSLNKINILSESYVSGSNVIIAERKLLYYGRNGAGKMYNSTPP